MSGVVSHTLINVDSFTRTGECRICGPVAVRRRGSGNAPWRCANQVNEYKRQRRQRLRDERRNSSALRVVTPCGDKVVLPPFDEELPDDDSWIDYTAEVRCSCRRVHLVFRRRQRDLGMREAGDVYVSNSQHDEVMWLDAHEHYHDGVMSERNTTNPDGPSIAGWATVGEDAADHGSADERAAEWAALTAP